jgi:predicted nucleic acid-binding Zn ribbon protein
VLPTQINAGRLIQWADDCGARCALIATGRRHEKLNETILIIEDEDGFDILD